MLLGRISWVYFVILVVWLVKKARFEKSFELFRGRHDVFSNLKFSPTKEYDSFDTSRSHADCSKCGARCKDMPSCSYCICDRSDKKYTYIRNDDGDGRCVRDEHILPESGCYHMADGSILHFLSYDKHCKIEKTCVLRKEYILFPERIHTAHTSVKKTCSFDWSESTYSRHGDSWKSFEDNNNYYFNLEATNHNTLVLKLGENMKDSRYDIYAITYTPSSAVNGSAFKKWNGSLIKLNIICNSTKIIRKPAINITHLRSSFHQIKMPKNGQMNKTAIFDSDGRYKHLNEQHCVLLKFETLPKYSKVKTITIVPSTIEISEASDATAIIKHSMKVHSGPTLTTSLSSKSDHDTLEATNEHPSNSTKATTSRSTTSIKPTDVNTMVTEFSNGKKKTNILISSPTLTTSLLSTSQEHSYHTTKPATTITKLFSSKTTGFPMSTTPSSKSDNSSGSSSSKTIVITVPIALLIVIVCVAGGFCVIYRRRGQPEIKTNEEEMQSREAHNSPKTFSEDPSQMYEPLKEDRRETGDEHFYQGLVGLHTQNKNTSVYDYIDDKIATNPGTEGEYSYPSNEILPRSFAPSQPLPSAPVVYQTLEEPDGSDNPAFEHDKLSDNKGHDPKGEPSDEKCKNPVYQTLEEPEAVQNPKLNELNDELTDKSLDSVEESVEKQSPPNPVYQTLEEQEAVQYPKSKLNDELAEKSLASVEELVGKQSHQNPVYQTLEEQEAIQGPNSKSDYESTDKSLEESLDRQSQNPVYQTLENPNGG